MDKLMLKIGFDSVVSILSVEGFYLPNFVNPDWKEERYAIFKRTAVKEPIGYLYKNHERGCYIEFEDKFSIAERSKIQKALEKGWDYWREQNENALKKRKSRNLEIIPKDERVKGRQCQEIRE